MTFSMSQRLYEGRLHDCVWVVRKHSAFDNVMLRVENTSFVYRKNMTFNMSGVYYGFFLQNFTGLYRSIYIHPYLFGFISFF